MLFAIAIVSPLWSWLEAINVQQEQQCPVKAIAVGMKDVVGPKGAVSMSQCANSAGDFYDRYYTVQGVDTIVPVGIYVPGW